MDGGRFRTEPWNGEYENAGGLHRAAGDLSGKALFFGYFLLGQQKKVPRATARKVLTSGPKRPSSEEGRKSKAFALSRELLFFAGAKKSNQKKAPFPDTPPAALWVASAFSDSPFHGSIGKRRPSMAAALRVSG